ncbi:hypothetical protein F511_31546 [Dorcoceras hygrometricum]|uniref:Uncharacterized protein n=1 Tax=Dorcoceras hygrometricum TaxID=472368 RepID=A0A2Z7AIS9_9LAMI|nr:hypothetical protein F511_31546 [Dorcoceras hygrometricum]
MAAHGSAPPASMSRNQCAKGQQPVGQRAQPAASNDRPTRNNLHGHRALRRAKQRPAMAQQLRNTTGHRAPSVVHPAAQQLARSSAQPPGRDARQARIACAYARGEGAWLRPVSRGNWHFTVGGGRLRQLGPRPEGRLLSQPALEGLTRSARTETPRKIGRNKFRRGAAAATMQGAGRRREVGGEVGRPRLRS